MNILLLIALALALAILTTAVGGARPQLRLNLPDRYRQMVANGQAGSVGAPKADLDKRAVVWSHMQEIRAQVDTNRTAGDTDDAGNGGSGWTAELRASWDKADAELTALDADIERDNTNGKLEERYQAIDEDTIVRGADGDIGSTNDAAKYRSTFIKFCRQGMQDLDVEERQILANNMDKSTEARALGAGVGAAGGYTVPQGFWAKVTETMKWFGGALAGADMLNTDSGNPLPWPSNNDTANVGYQLGENTAATNEADLAFGQLELGAYTYVSGPALVSFQILQDTGIDLEPFIARKMGERIGRIENTRYTLGTGTSQPQGYVTGATTGVTTASATAISLAEVINLEHSVDPAYRATGRCQYKFHDLVLAYLRTITDSQGRPLWQPSVQAGTPSTLNGYTYTVNNDMASGVTANNKTMAFGDFQSAFVVRKVNGASLLRLTERYAEYLQVGFIGFERTDSLVQDTSAVKLLVQHS